MLMWKASSRIDYALCDTTLLPFIKGIKMDTRRRIASDHKPLIVTIASEYWQQEHGIEWASDETEHATEKRLNMRGWNKEKIREYHSGQDGQWDPPG